ncbi:SAMC protein, partial [Polyodon spathula]|nr:SAMC protein [Polyodon spathula]
MLLAANISFHVVAGRCVFHSGKMTCDALLGLVYSVSDRTRFVAGKSSFHQKMDRSTDMVAAPFNDITKNNSQSKKAGGSAGMCVDLALFPLDTIKTRLQTPQGFHKAGGFRGIYAGVPSAAVGSFPNAAAFFVTYEYMKALLGNSSSPYMAPVKHMAAASLGEIIACLFRVPTEVIKQRTQACPSSSTYRVLLITLREEVGTSLKKSLKKALGRGLWV